MGPEGIDHSLTIVVIIMVIMVIITKQSLGQWGQKASITASPRLGSSLNVPTAPQPELATRACIQHPAHGIRLLSAGELVRTKFQSSPLGTCHLQPTFELANCMCILCSRLHIFWPGFGRSLIGTNINFKLVISIGINFRPHPISIHLFLLTKPTTGWFSTSHLCHQ